MSRLAGVLLVFALLSGCLGAKDAPPVASTPTRGDVESSPLLSKLQAAPEPAVPANLTPEASAQLAAAVLPEDPWWVVRVTATPEGALAAFWWMPPPGAAVAESDAPASSKDKVLALEVAPIFPEGKNGSAIAWGLVPFALAKGGGLEGGLGGTGETSARVTTYDATTSKPIEYHPKAAPTFALLGAPEEGKPLPLLFFAKTKEAMEVGLAFRVLDHDPFGSKSKEKPVPTSDAFVGARKSRPLAPVTVVGTGFAASSYYDLRSDGFPAGATSGFELVSGEPDVQMGPFAPARGAGGPWTGTLATKAAFPRGWGSAEALYVGLGEGGAHWSVAIDDRGKAHSGAGAGAEAWPTIFAGQLILAEGGGFAQSEGNAKLSLSFSLEAPGRPGLFQDVVLSQVELGSTLQELFGQPAAARNGIVPSTVPLGFVGDDGRVHPMPESRVPWTSAAWLFAAAQP